MNTPFFIFFTTLRADLTSGAFPQVIFRQGDPGGPDAEVVQVATAQQVRLPGKGCFMLVKGQAGDWRNNTAWYKVRFKMVSTCSKLAQNSAFR